MVKKILTKVHRGGVTREFLTEGFGFLEQVISQPIKYWKIIRHLTFYASESLLIAQVLTQENLLTQISHQRFSTNLSTENFIELNGIPIVEKVSPHTQEVQSGKMLTVLLM